MITCDKLEGVTDVYLLMYSPKPHLSLVLKYIKNLLILLPFEIHKIKCTNSDCRHRMLFHAFTFYFSEYFKKKHAHPFPPKNN